METVIVLAGGPGAPAPIELPAAAAVIAADGGAEHARALGLELDLAVGDFDSIPAGNLAGIARTERHPPGKDESDLELALAAALGMGAERILVLGGAGGRLDHLLGELLLLASDTLAGVHVDAQLGAAAVHVLRGERALAGERGELVSLFAVHGAAAGVVTEGLVYPLRGETLLPGSTRGLSNRFAEPRARVLLASGVALAVRPSGSVTAGSSW